MAVGGPSVPRARLMNAAHFLRGEVDAARVAPRVLPVSLHEGPLLNQEEKPDMTPEQLVGLLKIAGNGHIAPTRQDVSRFERKEQLQTKALERLGELEADSTCKCNFVLVK